MAGRSALRATATRAGRVRRGGRLSAVVLDALRVAATGLPRAAPVAVALAAGLAAGPAAAQLGGLSQPAGRVLESATPTRPDAERAPLPGAGVPPGPQPVIPDGEGFVLRRVEVEGATLFGEAELAPLWAPLIGGRLAPPDSADIAQAVETRYREAGYVFTRVVPTAIDAAAGTVRLRVIEARIESVTVEEPSGPVGPVRALVERLAAPLVGLSNPSLADLERALLLMNDIPGMVRATAVPRRGEGGTGAVALTINVERDALGGALFADNRQTPAFGPGVIGALGEWRSWSSAADSTRLTYTNSFGDALGQEFWTDLGLRRIVQLEHERHVGDEGARLGGRALYSTSAPEEELARLELEGEETELELWVEHPLIRTRPFSLWLRGGLYLRDGELSTRSRVITDEAYRSLFMEARVLTRDATGYVLGGIELVQGLDVFAASRKGDQDLSRADADPEATILRGHVEREQRLVGPYTLFGRAAGQIAGAPLVSGEEFELGGATFGRGYDPSEVLADHGYGGTLELRRTDTFEVGPTALQTVAYGFVDYGRVLSSGGGIPDADELWSFGIGLRARPTPDSLIGIEVAQPMEPLRRNGEESPRLYLSAQIQF